MVTLNLVLSLFIFIYKSIQTFWAITRPNRRKKIFRQYVTCKTLANFSIFWFFGSRIFIYCSISSIRISMDLSRWDLLVNGKKFYKSWILRLHFGQNVKNTKIDFSEKLRKIEKIFQRHFVGILIVFNWYSELRSQFLHRNRSSISKTIFVSRIVQIWVKIYENDQKFLDLAENWQYCIW